MKRITKTELDTLKRSHKRWCLARYILIVLAYTADWLFKLYVGFMVGGLKLALAMTTLDFLAKWYHLQSTKMRKPSKYQRIVRRKR